MNINLDHSDLTDAQWAVLSAYVAPNRRRGPQPRYNLRAVVNAILYRMHSGCEWRLLPKEYGASDAIYWYWYRWSRNGVWERIMAMMGEHSRNNACSIEQEERVAAPSSDTSETIGRERKNHLTRQVAPLRSAS
jgi:putative transposase